VAEASTSTLIEVHLLPLKYTVIWVELTHFSGYFLEITLALDSNQLQTGIADPLNLSHPDTLAVPVQNLGYFIGSHL